MTRSQMRQLQHEVRLLFRSRTPPQSVLDLAVEYRVTRTEVSAIAAKIGAVFPDVSNLEEWERYSKWYRRMAREEQRRVNR